MQYLLNLENVYVMIFETYSHNLYSIRDFYKKQVRIWVSLAIAQLGCQSDFVPRKEDICAQKSITFSQIAGLPEVVVKTNLLKTSVLI